MLKIPIRLSIYFTYTCLDSYFPLVKSKCQESWLLSELSYKIFWSYFTVLTHIYTHNTILLCNTYTYIFYHSMCVIKESKIISIFMCVMKYSPPALQPNRSLPRMIEKCSVFQKTGDVSPLYHPFRRAWNLELTSHSFVYYLPIRKQLKWNWKNGHDGYNQNSLQAL